MAARFKAIVVSEEQGRFVRHIAPRSLLDLPEGEVLIRVRFSSLNYKDAMSATGHRGVTRQYPHTPGIDAAGIVEESSSPLFGRGDEVVVHGFELGANIPGGWGGYVRVPAAWVMKLPAGLTLRESMIVGTAGFTAALSLERLQVVGLDRRSGPVLVTGATGGVGSLAVSILAKSGYEVIAATGKPEQEEYLRRLGAASVILRKDLADAPGRALLHSRWAGAIDTAGGEILASVLKGVRYGGAVAACGMAASPELRMTVYPFILRSVSLLGIDTANCPMKTRKLIWEKLAGSWKPDTLETVVTECALDDVEPRIAQALQGRLVGRVLIAHGR